MRLAQIKGALVEDDPIPNRAADARHWSGNLRVVMVLTLIWSVLSFVLPWLAGGLGFGDGPGDSSTVWWVSQGVPIAYVLIVWIYERRLNHLDQQHRRDRAA